MPVLMWQGGSGAEEDAEPANRRQARAAARANEQARQDAAHTHRQTKQQVQHGTIAMLCAALWCQLAVQLADIDRRRSTQGHVQLTILGYSPCSQDVTSHVCHCRLMTHGEPPRMQPGRQRSRNWRRKSHACR